MKDPAFLFYTADFLTGIAFMNNEEVGKYIRTLCLLHQHGGSLPKEDIELVVGTLSSRILDKLQADKNGRLFNQRLLDETNKRSAFCESRRSNIQQRYKKSTYVKHMKVHMENRNRDKDININKDIIISAFNDIWLRFPKRIGHKEALRHYLATVLTDQDKVDINKALANYLQSKTVKDGFIQNGSTWFNNWRDWIDYIEGGNNVNRGSKSRISGSHPKPEAGKYDAITEKVEDMPKV